MVNKNPGEYNTPAAQEPRTSETDPSEVSDPELPEIKVSKTVRSIPVNRRICKAIHTFISVLLGVPAYASQD